MTTDHGLRLCGVGFLAAISCCSAVAHAQERSTDNAVTQADDAFGFSIGRETLGIYSADNARGFSPTEAGNVRIDGLYFVPAQGLPSALVDSVNIRVGLSAQGYPFAAPSGIVDQRLRKPTAKRGASLIANFDQFGSAGIEVDGSLPVSERLAIAYGLTGNRVEFTDATSAWTHGQSLVARWRAGPVEIVPFWSLFNDYDDESSPQYVPAGPYLPKFAKAHRYEGPSWSASRVTGTNLGLLSSVALSDSWRLRTGAFRSLVNRKRGFTNLLDEEQPDGSGERITIADPPTANRALSGEARLSHTITDGPRLHIIDVSIRGRDTDRAFGGSDTIIEGPGRVGDKVKVPEPEFHFGELSRDLVRQVTIGVAYSGRWKQRGQIGFGLSRADFRKTTEAPGVAAARQQSTPWLYNANLALNLTRSIIAYAGYARGLEESGVAPANAANRNQPLPVILTEQKDAGIRIDFARGMKAIVGAFDLSRPYFGYEAGNVFAKVGTTRSRGVEFSLSGQLSPRLSLVAGGVILRPRVTKDSGVEGVIGSKPVGLPSHDFSLDANWQTSLDGVELDAGLRHRGRIAATTDNLVFVPARLQVEAGGHYRFKLAGRSAVLRVQLENIFDASDYGLGGSGVYWRPGGRFFSGYLTVDM